ncbi:uncharacterized protein LOC141915258 [Tubulanus polymorphus]|uniref:uncharacterized protein LOC141915258 n=1 Tax=Tubulanus polymorphus TaxID=672921 RepID=UPI003DA65827
MWNCFLDGKDLSVINASDSALITSTPGQQGALSETNRSARSIPAISPRQREIEPPLVPLNEQNQTSPTAAAAAAAAKSTDSGLGRSAQLKPASSDLTLQSSTSLVTGKDVIWEGGSRQSTPDIFTVEERVVTVHAHSPSTVSSGSQQESMRELQKSVSSQQDIRLTTDNLQDMGLPSGQQDMRLPMGNLQDMRLPNTQQDIRLPMGNLQDMRGSQHYAGSTDRSQQDLPQPGGGSQQELRQSRGNQQDLRQSRGSQQELRQSRGNQQELRQSGGSQQDLRQSGGSQQDLRQSGGNQQDLRQSGGSQQDLRQSRGNQQELRQSGGSQQDLRQSGWSQQDLRQSGGSQQSLPQYKSDQDLSQRKRVISTGSTTTVQNDPKSLATARDRLASKTKMLSNKPAVKLIQGEPVSGSEILIHKPTNEITISRFGSTQDKVRNIFSQRQDQRGPVKRVVQPTLLTDYKTEDEKTTEHNNKDSLTAAVAASAALAITQPFIKAQHDLETKLADFMTKLSNAEEKNLPTSERDEFRMNELEKQLNDLTQKRLDYLEKMQEKQFDLQQAQFIGMSRTRPSSRHHTTASSRQYTTNNTSSMSGRNKHYSSDSTVTDEDIESPLNTPAPRTRPPQPAVYTSTSPSKQTQTQQSSGRLFTEILAHQSPKSLNEIESQKMAPADKRTLYQPAARSRSSPTVTDGREQLIPDVEIKKQQTAHNQPSHVLIQESKSAPLLLQTPVQGGGFNKPLKDGPAPIDEYMKKPVTVPTSPYPTLTDITTKTLHNKQLSTVEEGENILNRIQSHRAILESNLQSIVRAQQNSDVYSLVDDLTRDSSTLEKVRIRKIVDDTIQCLQGEIKTEVEKDLEKLENIRKLTETIKSDSDKQKVQQKPRWVSGKGRVRAQSKIDTGLKKKIEIPEEAKSTTRSYGVTSTSAGKENIPKKSEKTKKPAVYKDAEYLDRVYGKAIYQNKRSTQKQPYLHYTNTAQQKSVVSTMRPAETINVKAIAQKTAKTQTSKTQLPQLPVSAGYIIGPKEGQLIPMAIPLGPPRQGGDAAPLSVVSMTENLTTAKNVAVVNIETTSETSPAAAAAAEQDRKINKLDIQVLPTVTIESYPPSIEEEQKQPRELNRVETVQTEQDDSLTDDWVGEGVTLPGYAASKPPVYHGPVFPPQAPPPLPAPTSNQLAEHIRTVDSAENKAVEWVEQEIMARILTELYQRQPSPPIDQTCDGGPYESDKSASFPLSETSSQTHSPIAGAMGQAGLQLFIDCGDSVDEDLIRDLVKEVLMEKISTALGDRTAVSEDLLVTPVPAPKRRNKRPDKKDEKTPEPSPIHPSPPKIFSPKKSPIVTPSPSLTESDTESTRELVSIWGKNPVLGIDEDENATHNYVHDTPLLTPNSHVTTPDRLQFHPSADKQPTPPSPARDKQQPASPRDRPTQPGEKQPSQPRDRPTQPRKEQRREESPKRPTPISRSAQTSPTEEPPAPVPERSPSPVEPVPVRSPSPVEPVPVRSPSPERCEIATSPIDLGHDKHDKSVSVNILPSSSPPAAAPPAAAPPAPAVEPVVRHDIERSPSPLSESSSTAPLSDTICDSISEGEWLMSKSEGQAPPFTFDQGKQFALAHLLKSEDDSIAAQSDFDSEAETPSVNKSVGEFLHPRGVPQPLKDPVLHVIAGLHHAPSGGAASSSSIWRQIPVDRSMGEIPQQQQQQPSLSGGDVSVPFAHSYGGDTVRRRLDIPPQSYTTGLKEHKTMSDEPLRLDELRESVGEISPGILHLPPSACSTPDAKSAFKSTNVIKSREQKLQEPIQVEPAQQELLDEPSVTGTRIIQVSPKPLEKISDSDPAALRETYSGAFGTINELGRSFTPDQMNVESLLQSGKYLTTTLSTEQTDKHSTEQTDKPSTSTADLSLAATGQTLGTTGQSDVFRTGTLGGTGYSDSFGTQSSEQKEPEMKLRGTYTFDDEGSRPSAPRAISVTMPRQDDTESETVEDLSEISVGAGAAH